MLGGEIMEIYATFLSLEKERFVVSPIMTVSDLKACFEERWGVPSEILSVQYRGRILDRISAALEIEGLFHLSEVEVSVDAWWSKVVSLSIRGDVGSLRRRVSVAVQHTTPSNRTFVCLFIAAFHGHAQSMSSVLKTYPSFDFATTTELTKRTVLHAAMSSGQVQCVEEIHKHSEILFSELMRIRDRSGRTAFELAWNHPRCSQMINFLNNALYDGEDFMPGKQRCFIEINSMTQALDTAPFSRQALPYQNVPSEISASDRKPEYGCPDHETYNQKPVLQDSSSSPLSPRLSLRPQSPKLSHLPSRPVQTQMPTTQTEQTHMGSSQSNGGGHDLPPPSPVTLPTLGEAHAGSHRQRRRGSDILESLPDSFTHAHTASNVSNGVHSTELTSRNSHQEKTRVPPPRPVAGLLVAPPRKVSSTRPRTSMSGRPIVNINRGYSSSRPASANAVGLLDDPPNSSSTPTNSGVRESVVSAGEKTRRISLIQKLKSQKIDPVQATDIESGVNPITSSVIEIDKERIEKPWNNWIKAITVEEGLEEHKGLVSEAELKASRASSAVGNARNRKTSFDDWVLRKTQQEVVQRSQPAPLPESRHPLTDKGKTFDEWKKEKAELEKKMKELEEAKIQQDSYIHGNPRRKISFEVWKKQKDNHELALRKQQANVSHPTEQASTFVKGKTYEEWLKEDDDRRVAEQASRLETLKRDKEVTEQKEEQRRKKSVASYQKWLRGKDTQAAKEKLKESLIQTFVEDPQVGKRSEADKNESRHELKFEK